MRKILLTLLSVFVITGAMAANTVVTVQQVTTAVELTNDVDYHITSTTPFTSTGSINIVNTEHAVVIFDALKPSIAKNQLAYISINGAKAVNGVNCDVRMYNNGAIIFPYSSDIKPLTVFEEANFGGESYNNFGLENSGGYMNTLNGTKKAWNNRIRSFKLKRGYMVTFSLKASGRGYSRCFIADKEDIAVNLPTLMAGRISSYRIFKWWDFSKKGIANNTSTEAISALNVTGCFDWAQGNSERLPDCEWVPNHIYEDWPSSSACGSVTGSCHMKTNNEPLNESDDHPQTLDEILANWENLMRTGQRLCTPASWDGSPNFIKQFLDSIDARGWRCDIVDLHCYWPEGSFNNLGNMYNNYGQRPIWISEFCWGASWNNNGVFAYRDNMDEGLRQDSIVMGRILDRLNSWDYVERYFYWNSEHDVSKIYKGGSLTPLGKYYAKMNTGLGYKTNHQHIPREAPRIYPPKMGTITFNPVQSTATITWSDTNGDLLDKMYLERKIDKGDWEIIREIALNEDNGEYSAKDTAMVAGNYSYRVRTIAWNGSERKSGEIYNIINGTQKLGNSLVQYGTLEVNDKNDTYNYFAETYPNLDSRNIKLQPTVVFGGVTNVNAAAMLVERVSTVRYSKGEYFCFKANVEPATVAVTTSDKTDFYQTAKEVTRMITAAPGCGQIGTLKYEAGLLDSLVNKYGQKEKLAVSDTVSYTFTEPFEDTPIVLATPLYSSAKYPIFWRVFDVTPEGFKIVLQRQYSLDSDILKPAANVMFFAIEKGETPDGGGKLITVGDTLMTFTSVSSLNRNIELYKEYENVNPLVQLQSLNTDVAAVLRIKPNITGTVNKFSIRAQIDKSNTTIGTININNPFVERLGWVIISDDPNYEDGIESIRIARDDNKLTAYPSIVTQYVCVRDDNATNVAIYGMNGQKLAASKLNMGQTNIDMSSLPAGMYIIRTNAGNSTKIIKK